MADVEERLLPMITTALEAALALASDRHAGRYWKRVAELAAAAAALAAAGSTLARAQ